MKSKSCSEESTKSLKTTSISGLLLVLFSFALLVILLASYVIECTRRLNLCLSPLAIYIVGLPPFVGNNE